MLALWFGYNRGYHHGVQNERRAWESTAQWNRSTVMLDNTTPPPRVVYIHPGARQFVADSRGLPPKNVPDPRNVPVK